MYQYGIFATHCERFANYAFSGKSPEIALIAHHNAFTQKFRTVYKTAIVLSREVQKQQEELFYDNQLTLQYLTNGKTEKLMIYLGMQAKRLQNGMTADEIDAVKKRAEEAFELHVE